MHVGGNKFLFADDDAEYMYEAVRWGPWLCSSDDVSASASEAVGATRRVSDIVPVGRAGAGEGDSEGEGIAAMDSLLGSGAEAVETSVTVFVAVWPIATLSLRLWDMVGVCGAGADTEKGWEAVALPEPNDSDSDVVSG